jgi:hypothetical protein
MPSVDAAQIHPEFGYFAPTMRFRRQLALILKGGALGALAGAVAMFALTMDHEEEKAVAMLATPVAFPPAAPTPQAQVPAQTAAAPAAAAATPASPPRPIRTPTRPARIAAMESVAPPVRFVPETIALPAVTPRDLQLRGSVLPEIAANASKPALQAPSTVGASPAASEAAVASAPVPAAKTVAKPKKKLVRRSPPEPEPRAAFAGPPSRPFGLPIFGFGW